MYRLTDEQIDFISEDIKRRGIVLPDLQNNLLDHICCIIENTFEEGGDFESYYCKILKTFYEKSLEEIEEETISLLIYKNYYAMKKLMLISGLISSCLVSAGIVFKFMHWPGAGVMLVLGIGLCSVLFLPLLFLLKLKESTRLQNKVVALSGMLSSITLSLGILFKIMHWPGANALGIIAFASLIGIFLPSFFYTGIRNPETKTNTIVVSLIIILGSGLFLALVNARPSATIAEKSIYSATQLQKIVNYSTQLKPENNDTFNLNHVGKDYLLLNEKANQIQHAIQELSIKLYNKSEETTSNKVLFNELINPANYKEATNYLFGNDKTPDEPLILLKKQIVDFIALLPEKKQVQAKYLLDLNGSLNHNDEHESWEMMYFYTTPISVLLQNLNQIQLIVVLMQNSKL